MSRNYGMTRFFFSKSIFFENAAACMTWELAESGVSFVTTVINGSDLVPSFCAASLDDLRAEVYVLSLLLTINRWGSWLVSNHVYECR